MPSLKTIVRLSSICILLSACQPPASPASDYAHRLENVLNVEHRATNNNSAPPSYPSPREFGTLKADNQLSIREFLSLRECKLHNVIATRNSLMGKVALSSQLLFNDLKILDTGPQCLAVLRNNNQTNLATKLNTYLEQKHASIDSSLWRAILGYHENRQFWSANTPIKDYPNSLLKESIPSIIALTDFVKQVKNGRTGFSNSETTAIEQHLGNLRFGDGGILLRQLLSLSNSLEIANQAVKQRLQHALCLDSNTTPQSHHLQNVVNKYFIAKVQKYAVDLNRRAEQLMPAYLALETSLDSGAPASYRIWSEQRIQMMQTAQDASKQHVLLMQQLFAQCGLTPGKAAA